MLIDTVGHGYGKRSEVLGMQPSSLQVEVRPLRTSGAGRVLISDVIVTVPEYLPPRPSAPIQVQKQALSLQKQSPWSLSRITLSLSRSIPLE